MKDKITGNNRPGFGLLGTLQIVFLVLKLTGNIDWGWFWVLAPTLLPICLVLAGGIIYALFLLAMIGLGLRTYDEVLKKTKKDEQE